MRAYLKMALVLVTGSTYMPNMAQGADFSCPSTIALDLCEQLKGLGQDELMSFSITFKRTPFDSADTDPEKDTTASPGDSGSFAIYAEYTRDLFSKYDLRWPADTGERAAAPLEYEGTYKLFASKSTLQALSLESYVQEIERWAPDGPTSALLSNPKRLNSLAPQGSFNAMGQQLPPSHAKTSAPKFWIRNR